MTEIARGLLNWVESLAVTTTNCNTPNFEDPSGHLLLNTIIKDYLKSLFILYIDLEDKKCIYFICLPFNSIVFKISGSQCC